MSDFEEKDEISKSAELNVESENENDVNKDVSNNKKRVNILKYINNISNAVLKTFTRFPMAILFFIALAGLAIYRIEIPYEEIRYYNELLDRIMAVLALGIPLSLSVDLLFERFQIKKTIIRRYGSYIIELELLALYFFYLMPKLDSMVPALRLTFIISALILAFLFIPYLFKKENFEIYITKLIMRVITSAFFTVVLGAGMSAILFAIKSLLYEAMDTNLYAYVWIISWLVFAPIHFLYGVPKIDHKFESEDYNKVLKVLLLYIIMPLIAVYTLVLYIYFGKIIVTRVWPSGIVSYLVLSYTAVGIATVFLITPLQAFNNWVRKFIFIFSKFIFPLLAMMFVSIGMRINDFGVTENRYFIVLIGIWATLAMIFINFNNGKRNIILPISLSVVILIAVLGPLSAFNISKASQSQRFYNILVNNNMIKEDKIVKAGNIDNKDKKEIVAILRYFSKSHSFSDLKYLPADFDFQKTEAVFGFKQEDIIDNEHRYFNYSVNQIKALPITGYDSLFKLEFYKYSTKHNVIYEEEILSNLEKIKLVVDNNYKLILFVDGAEVYKKDLNEFVKTLYEKYGIQYKDYNLIPQDMILIHSDENVDLKIIFNRIDGNQKAESNQLEINGVDAYVLVKLK